MGARMRMIKWSVVSGMAGLLGSVTVFALPYSYPAVRYVSPHGASLGGMTVPLSDEIGNALFNNPAALGRSSRFRAEFLNLNLDGNTNLLSNLTTVPSFFSLGGYTGTLNQNPGAVFSGGFGNLTALSFGGFGVGVLIQDRVRAYSDGSQVHYESRSHLIPAVGYGISLARGVMRIGYSLQYVNEVSGTGQAPANSSAAFLGGIREGRGISHTLGMNLVFPFQYIPTVSLVARNLFGTRFQSGALMSRATNSSGTPPAQEMTVDAAFHFMTRVSGPVKSFWYFQARDVLGKTGMNIADRLGFGVDFSVSQAVAIRLGLDRTRPSAGIGYRSEGSEINLAYYKDPSPFAGIPADTRIALQYKIFFQDRNSRDRDPVNSAR
jgi:hypothetical protein